MDILVVAQNMEREGITYYEKLATETPVSELKGVFSFLAREEQHHLELFQALGQKTAIPEADDATTMNKVKEIFQKLTKSFTLPEIVYDYEAAYRKALSMEEESVRYYSEMMNAIDDDQKQTLESIINQEKSHVKLLESLIDFVSNPKVWLENSEWNHLDTY
jgi:rubrerythrin